MVVYRAAILTQHLVYILCANRQARYPNGQSRIVYIGSTKNGAKRIAESLAFRAKEVLDRYGFTSVTAHIVTTGSPSWKQLERGLILSFKDTFGDKPSCNVQGKGFRWQGEDKVFSKSRLSAIVDKYSK